jgi:hypothetical protein
MGQSRKIYPINKYKKVDLIKSLYQEAQSLFIKFKRGIKKEVSISNLGGENVIENLYESPTFLKLEA